jgi:hypothetical protein
MVGLLDAERRLGAHRKGRMIEKTVHAPLISNQWATTMRFLPLSFAS